MYRPINITGIEGETTLKRKHLYILTGLSALTGLGSAFFIGIGSSVSAALAASASVLFIEYAIEKSVSLKNRSFIKAFNKTSVTIIEVIILGGLLLSQDLPGAVTVATFSGLVVFKTLVDNVESHTGDRLDPKFGRRGRLTAVIAGMFLSSMNSYYILLAAYVVVGMLLYDTGQVLYRLRDRENSSELKDRILSRQ